MLKKKQEGKLTNKEMYDVLQGIKKLSNMKVSGKFAYALTKNKAMIEHEIKVLQDTFPETEDYIQYAKKSEAKRLELCEKFAEKENGKPKMILEMVEGQPKQKFDIAQDRMPKFNEELKVELAKIDKIHEKDIKRREEQLKEFNSLMDEPTNVEFFMVSNGLIPDNISPDELSYILPIIQD